ncbi:pseudouridine synthase [Hymenobacter nivis]|uniref:Pseudouridine synthase n=1 Tax=Hymenobacter nivis TaxID=1850093 RepID=A0A502HBG2_9BACT|nr:pseudouridine synthase [Hymenobacter nivis]TPG72089.1 pseudouridine synthase [Hymenobacter nivis]
MRYILLNKPYEVLTQFTDEAGRATLKDFVPVPHIYPVGRLDFDSEGLLLLTDDKALQHRLSDPRYKVFKTYWAQVEGEVTTEALEKLRRGVVIKEGRTAPAQATDMPEPEGLWARSTPIRYRASIPTTWLEIRISQGMNRQVRKMCAAVGLPCLRLIRARIDELDLGALAPGEWRELTPEESRKLKAKFSATKDPANRQVAAKPVPGAPAASAAPPTRRPGGGPAERGAPRRPR